MNRRTVLRFGLGGAALLAVGGIGLSLRGGVPRAPARPLQALSEREFAVLAAVADCILPGGEGFPSAAELQVAERTDALLAASDPRVVEELGSLLRLMDNALAGLLLGGSPTPFTALSAAEQEALLTSWRDSSLALKKGAFKALRSACLLAYFTNPGSFAAVGYPGPPDFSGLDLEEPLPVPS